MPEKLCHEISIILTLNQRNECQDEICDGTHCMIKHVIQSPDATTQVLYNGFDADENGGVTLCQLFLIHTSLCVDELITDAVDTRGR